MQRFDSRDEKVRRVLRRVSAPMCKRQVYAFANVLKKDLLEQGMAPEDVLKVLRSSIKAYTRQCLHTNSQCMALVSDAVSYFLGSRDQGRDLIGRVVAHHVFFREGSGLEVPLSGSEQEAEVAESFVSAVAPAPLVEYFLVSVRGSVEGVDRFRSVPVLFGSDEGLLADFKTRLEAILVDYRMDEEDEGGPVFWETAFLDKRMLEISREILREVRDRLLDIGHDHYLRILDNLRQKYRNNTGSLRIRRSFVEDDVRQLLRSLDRALESLGDD